MYKCKRRYIDSERWILSSMKIDPMYLIIALFLVQVVLFILLININMKYNRLKAAYTTFLKGKDGKNLEESFFEKFRLLDEVEEIAKENKEEVRNLRKQVQKTYQKVGIVRYDAFNEMGGNLSFVLTMLNDQNSGWLLNAMHSREGCYTYIKEIINGKSYVELGEEEKESLERAIFQEVYDIKDVDFKKTAKRA